MHIYFFGIVMMALQFSGQSTFVALGYSRHAIFFSLLRKAIIVIPLTIWLPTVAGLGTTGVFLAEPISNKGVETGMREGKAESSDAGVHGHCPNVSFICLVA